MFFDFTSAGRVEEGELRGAKSALGTRYYFRQSPRRVLYLDLSAEQGRNLDADQQILLGGDSGLRGYPLRYQAGEGRWLFTAEQRFFTNWYPVPDVQRRRRGVLRHGLHLGTRSTG